MYDNYVDRSNVQIGTKNGPSNFFKLNLYNDKPTIPGYNPDKGDCNATLTGATEGLFYPKNLNDETVINYYRRTICRTLPLHYNSTTEKQGMKVLEYVLRPESFARLENKSADCTNGKYEFDIPDGMSDLSKCYFNFPMVLSLPHFYGHNNGKWVERLGGIKPNQTLHESKIYAEPVMGVGLHQFARSQVNVLVQDLSNYPQKYHKFSNMVVPIFWGEFVSIL